MDRFTVQFKGFEDTGWKTQGSGMSEQEANSVWALMTSPEERHKYRAVRALRVLEAHRFEFGGFVK